MTLPDIPVAPFRWADIPQVDEVTIPFLGPDGQRSSTARALLRSRATLAARYDRLVSSSDPLQGRFHVAVNRATPDGDTPVLLPAEGIGLAEAICGYAAGSALGEPSRRHRLGPRGSAGESGGP
ncbi:hypothetical protein AB0G20_21340 [Streptomyces sp. NPDC024017]|uniref:hypothetical protein n=1 Tax=Streptomyces sp. NPDC024017 TaxID=3154326 RepID=UPI0033D379E5